MTRTIPLESLRITPPSTDEDIRARIASGQVAEMSLEHAGIDDEDEPVQLIGIRNGAGVPDTFVNDFFAAEAPSETNQLIPTAWVNRAIDRELTSTANLHIDNEASPTETKMNYDNEATNATEANENEEFPVTEATAAQVEDILGKHTSTKYPQPKMFFCSPFGIPIPVISSTPEHARAMAKKAIERLAKQQKAMLKSSPIKPIVGHGPIQASDLL